jgi:cytochrome b6-f complex iron-sulfur subunit
MSEKISRRDFIRKSAFGVAAGTIALSGLDIAKLAAQSGRAKVIKNGDDIVVKLSDEKNKALATVGGCLYLDDDNILIRLSDTQFMSLNLTCTHKGCTVEYNGTKFVCPCHGSEYDREGKVLLGPSTKPLKTYDTVYDAAANTVTVKMGKKEETKEK